MKATIPIPGGVQTVTLGNVRFGIPDDFSISPTEDNPDYESDDYLSISAKTYSNGEDTIDIGVMYSPTADIDADAVVEESGGKSSETLMGEDGILEEYDDGYAFNCGVGNRVVMVYVTDPDLFDKITILGEGVFGANTFFFYMQSLHPQNHTIESECIIQCRFTSLTGRLLNRPMTYAQVE